MTVPLKSLNQIAENNGYPVDAFLFVQRGLDFTVKRIHGEEPERAVYEETEEVPQSRHISGQELCLGLRDFAKREYGLLARGVLARWRINHSEDFGRIVFAMVKGGLMHKTQEDTIADFIDVFHFEEAFSEPLLLGENA
jgi:uncharacterized repeat protein (TIGR04138 family)